MNNRTKFDRMYHALTVTRGYSDGKARRIIGAYQRGTLRRKKKGKPVAKQVYITIDGEICATKELADEHEAPIFEAWLQKSPWVNARDFLSTARGPQAAELKHYFLRYDGCPPKPNDHLDALRMELSDAKALIDTLTPDAARWAYVKRHLGFSRSPTTTHHVFGLDVFGEMGDNLDAMIDASAKVVASDAVRPFVALRDKSPLAHFAPMGAARPGDGSPKPLPFCAAVRDGDEGDDEGGPTYRPLTARGMTARDAAEIVRSTLPTEEDQ